MRVSLDLYPGETIGLFGPNEAGKTTLVRIIAGLLSADSGDVVWESEGRSCSLVQQWA
ncbi:ATP-binding cassette domain-containing protein [Cutibacterium porci]|uniref:ATP-binding cassette domain-containing protein n=1 Tax=Cutibacterium porci TaxID=2605781 RepID=UPI0012B2AE6F|nr:ATP-binding cassette domain-containing protein [Cutibacterium porci]